MFFYSAIVPAGVLDKDRERGRSHYYKCKNEMLPSTIDKEEETRKREKGRSQTQTKF
ncbi:hypothetical protein [Microcoleus sp. S36b_A2]|uniref:hypothetical protein n=1 Tax=Microcoleus sp. S36b_A2 TaxID=3055418 RepID=UPI002FD234CE